VTSPDVVVIGGGIVGTATAEFLARDGLRVTLIEREGIGCAASGRNSGVVQQPLDAALASLYRAGLPLYRELAADPDAGFVMPAQPSGLLYASLDPRAPAALALELRETQPELRAELLDGPALRRLEPAIADDVTACRIDIGYPVEPGGATRGFAAIARRDGVAIVEDREARLEVRDGSPRVTTADGALSPGVVVVAAGPWTPTVIDHGGRWRPIRSLWGVIAEVELSNPPRHVLEEAELDETIEPPAPDVTVAGQRADAGIGFSLVTAAGRSAVGSTFLDDEPDATPLVPRIVERGARFVPEIARVPVRSVRVCARPLSADGRPLIGRVPWLAGVFVAAGHGPWGISTGPGSARLVADLVDGRVVDPPVAVDPARFGAPR
jgi:D-hydroxyproline dehydrogenase subunit beta